MLNIPKTYRKPLLFALLLHIAILVALVVHFSENRFRAPGPVAQTKQPAIVQAKAVSQQQIDRQIKQIKQAEHEKHVREERRLARIQAKALAAKRARIREQQRIKQLKVAQLKLQRERTAAAKAAKLKHQQELKRLAAEQQKIQQKMLDQQLDSEAKNLNAIKSAQVKGVVDRYKAAILQKLQGYWHVPSDIDHNLHCLYQVELAPNGVVLQATLIKSSGNPALDRIARATIMRASPLPVPHDPAVFDKMRELQLIMTPGNKSFSWVQ